MKLLTLNDLYNYFSTQNKSVRFSAEKDNTNILVGIPATIKFEKNDKDTEGLAPVHLSACHTNQNRNGSNISKKNMKKALPSFANRPILAFIHKVDDEDEFGGHEMHLDDDDNLVYDEIPVGHIPESNNATLEYDEKKDRHYVEIDGWLYEEYNKSKDILERLGESPVSVELNIRELSYDAKNKLLNIEDFFFEGVTILGVTEDGDEIKPGMEGANIKLADFGEAKSAFSFNEELLKQLQMLNSKLEAFDIDINGRKEDETVKFDELLAKYNVTIDDIDFEYEDMSDEELESKFEELFGDNSDDSENEDPTSDNFEDESEEDSSEEDFEDTSEEENSDENFEEESNEGSENEEDFEENTDDNENEEDNYSASYSVSVNGIKKEFEISLSQIISGLTELVNATYGESDNAWYCVDVYEDSKTVVMIDYWSNKAFRQSYKVRSGQYTLVGDRVEVFSQWLTADEISKLDELKSNYSAIESKLQKYVDAENDANKINILNSEDYSAIADSEEFKKLINDREQFSVEEVQSKCDEMLLNFVKSNNKFSENKPKKDSKFIVKPEQNKKGKGRYGNLFSK